MRHFHELGSPLLDWENELLPEEKQAREKRFRADMRETWERVALSGQTPGVTSCIRSEIAESWQRCRDYGIDPSAARLGRRITGRHFQELLKESSAFLQASLTVAEQLADILRASGYLFLVFDRNCVCLHQEGSRLNGPQYEQINLAEGAVWTEEVMGTTSTALSAIYQIPFQVIGPEHFWRSLHCGTCSSAPVIDSGGQVLGILSIAALSGWPSHLHTLGLATFAASVIQNQLGISTKVTTWANNSSFSDTDVSRRKLFTFENLVGEAPAFQRAINQAQKAAHSDVNVLLTGESGTGKELFAQAIHNASTPKAPFVPVNCAALPPSLIESELFGYEGGAFTGAKREGHPGKFEQANGGTLFLDEIGEMPLELQPVLLRVLEESNVVRLGGNRRLPIKIRLISATNRNLEKEICNGRFRSDLYFRLAVFPIDIPPLRERLEDIPLLVNHLIKKICLRLGRKIPLVQPEIIQLFMTLSWRGNVRELENILEYMAVNAANDFLTTSDLPAWLTQKAKEGFSGRGSSPGSVDSLAVMEKQAIIKALESTKTLKEAAALLGIGRNTLYRKLKQYEISRPHLPE